VALGAFAFVGKFEDERAVRFAFGAGVAAKIGQFAVRQRQYVAANFDRVLAVVRLEGVGIGADQRAGRDDRRALLFRGPADVLLLNAESVLLVTELKVTL